MVRQVEHFEVTVAAGTAKTAPQVTDLSMPARLVRWVEVMIPPGPAGTVGFALGAAGARVIPTTEGAWIVGNDRVIRWDLEGQIESGAWQVQSYNLGVYDHTLYIDFGVDVPGAIIEGAPLLPLPAGAITG